MAHARARRMLSVTLSSRVHALLDGLPNKSDYVDAILAHHPPPPLETVEDIARLIQERHPYVIDAETGDVRDRLPSFGGPRPSTSARGEPVTWSHGLVCDATGVIWPRDAWERDAILASVPCSRQSAKP